MENRKLLGKTGNVARLEDLKTSKTVCVKKNFKIFTSKIGIGKMF